MRCKCRIPWSSHRRLYGATFCQGCQLSGLSQGCSPSPSGCQGTYREDAVFCGGSRISFEDSSPTRRRSPCFFYLGIPRLFKQDIDFGPSFTEQS